MSIFSEEFLQHLATSLEVDEEDLKSTVSNFFDGSVKVTKKPSKVSSENSSNDSHKCERIPRGKDEPCGKTAKNYIDEDGEIHWYCGTENGGCYKCILGQQNRQTKVVPKKPSAPKSSKKAAPKPTTLKGKKKLADTNSESLIKKVTKRQQLLLKKKTVNGKKVYMDDNTRVLVDKSTREAYGKLAKNNKDIKPLDDDDVRWLEASGISIRKEESEQSSSEEESSDILLSSEEEEDEDGKELSEDDSDSELLSDSEILLDSSEES